MPDSVSSLTMSLEAGVVTTAVRVASDVDLAPEVLLARACAALSARFTRMDDPLLAVAVSSDADRVRRSWSPGTWSVAQELEHEVLRLRTRR